MLQAPRSALSIRRLKRLISEHKLAIKHDGIHESLEKNQEFHFLIYKAWGSGNPWNTETVPLGFRFFNVLKLAALNRQRAAFHITMAHLQDHHRSRGRQ